MEDSIERIEVGGNGSTPTTFVGQYVEALDERLESHNLYEDQSVFKACAPVWHQSDRTAGWSKSGYHGWVYGYSLHLTCNQAAFLKLAQIEKGAYSETQALTDKEGAFLHVLRPDTVSGDNSYTKVRCIRRWASQGVVLLLAECLAMPVSIAPQLRERLLSGTPVDDFDAAVRATWDDFSFSHPGGETNAAAQQRVVTFVEALCCQHQGQHVVLSTHGNLLALLLQHVDPSVDFAFWQSLTMPDVFQWSPGADEKTRIERLWPPSAEQAV